MATLDDLLQQGLLHTFELPDWEARLPIRPLYVASEIFDWVTNTPALHSAALKEGGRTLAEHLEQTFCDFRCSKRPPAGDLRRMQPNKHGVWKLHPPRLRVYGWCPQTETFVAVTAALEDDTKTYKKLNNQKMQEVRTFIKIHGLTVELGDVLKVFPVKV